MCVRTRTCTSLQYFRVFVIFFVSFFFLFVFLTVDCAEVKVFTVNTSQKYFYKPKVSGCFACVELRELQKRKKKQNNNEAMKKMYG